MLSYRRYAENIQVTKSTDLTVYDIAYYSGDTGRTLHHLSQPGVSLSSDGQTFTVTHVAILTQDDEDYTSLHLRIRQHSLLPWKEIKQYKALYVSEIPILHWFTVHDSLGNVYYGLRCQAEEDSHFFALYQTQSGIFSSDAELCIHNFPQEARWIELRYTRDGRNLSLRIDLTGGDGA